MPPTDEVPRDRLVRIDVTPEMVASGVEALLDSFSEEHLSWRTPGLERAVADVFEAMLAGGGIPSLRDQAVIDSAFELRFVYLRNRSGVPERHRP